MVCLLLNCAADLDSIVSAIAFAFYLRQVHGIDAVPAIQNTADCVRLKPEIAFAFEKAANLSLNDVLSSIAQTPQLPPEAFSAGISLVDHNESAFGADAAVWWIVDHHDASRASPVLRASNIAPVASTCTLVSEMLLEARLCCLPVLRLLLAAVCVDCSAFDAACSVATGRDRTVFLALHAATVAASGTSQSPFEFARRFFDDFRRVRNSAVLSIQQILVVDFKDYVFGCCDGDHATYGISSIIDRCIASEKDADLAAASVKLLHERQLKFALLFCKSCVFDGGKERENCVIFVHNAKMRDLFDEIARLLCNEGILAQPKNILFCTWQQTSLTKNRLLNEKCSRKVFQPAFHRILEELGTQICHRFTSQTECDEAACTHRAPHPTQKSA